MTYHLCPTYGLIGYPLGHSFSPVYFGEKFLREGIDAVYMAFPLENIADLKSLISRHPELSGLNVTTPYKQAVIAFLNQIDSAAAAIGAVNCIVIKEWRLTGYNTDWLGFRDSLSPLLESHHVSALVLGNGGASLAIRYALMKMGIPFQTVSATPGKADYLYTELTAEIVGKYHLIINTTVLGTEGNGCPAIPYEAVTSKHLLYDLVYNPPLTPFLSEGEKRGAVIKNGMQMLELQAEASWKLWTQE